MKLYTDEDFKMIKEVICNNAPDEWVNYYIKMCEIHGFHPLLKLAYLIRYGNTYTFVTSISGIRGVVMKTGEFGGRTDTLFFDKDNNSYNQWIFDYPPVLCKVGVYRKGIELPFWGAARFNDFKKTGEFWNKMPSTMIAKVAESIALRLAFPDVLSGLYSEDEMNPNIKSYSQNTNQVASIPIDSVDNTELIKEIDDLLIDHPLVGIKIKARNFVDNNANDTNSLIKLKKRIIETHNKYLDTIRQFDTLTTKEEADILFNGLEDVFKQDTYLCNIYKIFDTPKEVSIPC